MADNKNTEVLPASEPAAPVQEAPVVVREKRSWFRPLISALVVVAALVVGGIGGFAIATATQGGRGALEQGQFPGGPGFGQGQQGQAPQSGNGQNGQGGPSGQNGERPQPPSDQSGSDDSGSDDSGDDSSTDG